MKGMRTVLAFGVFLVLVSYGMAWYATGGTGSPLALDDQRVKASLDSLASDIYHRKLATDGNLERAWLSGDVRGYGVNLIIRFNDYPWLATVVFSEDAAPLESSVRVSGGLPRYLNRIGIALVALWLIMGHLLPRIFWPKCPDCPGRDRKSVV